MIWSGWSIFWGANPFSTSSTMFQIVMKRHTLSTFTLHCRMIHSSSKLRTIAMEQFHPWAVTIPQLWTKAIHIRRQLWFILMPLTQKYLIWWYKQTCPVRAQRVIQTIIWSRVLYFWFRLAILKSWGKYVFSYYYRIHLSIHSSIHSFKPLSSK